MAAKNTKSKSVSALAPKMHQGMGRALELQAKFKGLGSMNAPHGKKGAATKQTPLMKKASGSSKKTPTPSANRGEASQVKF